MAAPRVGLAAFCDDVRQEIGNKFSLMGVYTGDMILPASPLPGIPLLLPKIVIVTWLTSDIDDAPEHVTYRVLLPPDRTEIIRQEITSPPAKFAEGATKATLQTMITIGPLTLTHEGFLEVLADTGREEIRMGRLLMKFAPQPESISPAPG